VRTLYDYEQQAAMQETSAADTNTKKFDAPFSSTQVIDNNDNIMKTAPVRNSHLTDKYICAPD